MGFNSFFKAVFLLHRSKLEETSNPSIDPSEYRATGCAGREGVREGGTPVSVCLREGGWQCHVLSVTTSTQDLKSI